MKEVIWTLGAIATVSLVFTGLCIGMMKFKDLVEYLKNKFHE